MPPDDPFDSEPKTTEQMRRYLVEIYRLGQDKAWINSSLLAEKVDVTPPAATRMVQRLKQLGLAKYQLYNGVRLTPAGAKIAVLELRRYRLVKCFLVDILGFGWHELHDVAQKMYEAVSPAIEERIDLLLGHPQICPHGEPIPTRSGQILNLNDKPLTVIPNGQKGKITRVKTRDSSKLSYLAELNLFPGTPFELIQRLPFNGPLQLKISEQEQVISLEMASTLWVRC